MGKFHQCLTELSAYDTIMAGYYSLTFLFYFFFFFCACHILRTQDAGVLKFYIWVSHGKIPDPYFFLVFFFS